MDKALKNKLDELLSFAKEKGLYEVTLKDGSTKISFRRNTNGNGNAAPAPEVEALETQEQDIQENLEEIRSPVVGRFRRTKEKNRPPLVVKGNHVKPGTRLAVVECMKIPTDVVSFCAGEIVDIVVEDGQPVEFGQPLFYVRKSGSAD